MSAPAPTIPDAWYARQAEAPLDPNLLVLRGEEGEFFKAQTGIKDDEKLKEHILDVQRRAFAVWPYPCIRRFGFTKLKISRFPVYEEALRLGREREGAILLDLGCCFGNDARKAVSDGFPGTQVIASDLRGEFWTLGHELFRDTPETCKIRFVEGDVFSSAFINPHETSLVDSDSTDPIAKCLETKSLNPLQKRVSLIHTSAFFHLFDEAGQFEIAKRCEALLSMQPGSMVFGSHGGAATAGIRNEGRDAWAHSPESWKEMWKKAVPDGSVQVEAQIVDWARERGPEGVKLTDVEAKEIRQGRRPDGGWLVWVVRRV